MLNVSQALRQWQLEKETNQGMMIEVTEATTSNQVHPVALGLITGKQSTDEKEVCSVCHSIQYPPLPPTCMTSFMNGPLAR